MKARKATIIYNPKSGRPGRRGDHAREMVRLLGERGVEAEARSTTGPLHATRLAREASEGGADIVVSYGGDGTLNEVVQGLVGSRAALAVWAGGTANVVARDLCMPRSIERLADVIAEGRSKRIALGVARNPTSQSAQGRYFLMFAGIGLDASVARKVNAKLKRRTGEFAFWVEGMKHIVTWKADPFVIDVDGKSYEGVFALIGNGKGYGGGLCMTAQAKLEDPWFEVYIVPRRVTNLAYLRDLVACYRGKPLVPGVHIVRGRRIIVNSSHEPWVEADGEVLGPLPMQFDVVPDALSIITP